jgi:hypothetical protein
MQFVCFIGKVLQQLDLHSSQGGHKLVSWFLIDIKHNTFWPNTLPCTLVEAYNVYTKK